MVAELALAKEPPPPLQEPVAGVVVTLNDAVAPLHMVIGVVGVNVPAAVIVTLT